MKEAIEMLEHQTFIWLNTAPSYPRDKNNSALHAKDRENAILFTQSREIQVPY